MRGLAILGAPSSAGANMPGLEQAPQHLRLCGLNSALARQGFELTDYGDCVPVTYAPDRNKTARNIEQVVAAARDVYQRSKAIFERDQFLILVGGDCTVTAGLVAAARGSHERLGLAYLDSQTDLNSPATTNTGILDSMGLAHMLGCVRNDLSAIGENFPLIDAERVAVFGFHPDRITDAEHRVLEEHPIAQYPATAIAEGVEAAAKHALERLLATCDAFILHFDIDIIDFAAFPAADAPVYRGFGLEFDDAMTALGIFARSERCLGVAITEFNPDRDRSGALGRQFVGALAETLAARP